jgi:hypothetical protein
MSPPISSAIKERVIQLYLEGKGRNAIAQILNSSHTRISQGSVTNILRRKGCNSAHSEARPQEVTPRPPSPDDSTGQSQGHVPLSTEDAKGQEHIPVPEDAKRPEGLVTSGEVNLVSQVNVGLVNRVELTQVQAQDEDQDLEEGWSMVFEQVMEVKKQRRELEQQRMQVDRARYDLEIREIKLLEAEPLIPIARRLQDLGTDINQFLPWIETEKAEAGKMDLGTASYRVAQDLRSRLGVLSRRSNDSHF